MSKIYIDRISFRTSRTIKQRLGKLARRLGLRESDVARKAFARGLEAVEAIADHEDQNNA